MAKEQMLLRVEKIGSLILTIRGCRVMLDSDLARIYGVQLKRLNEQVRRNPGRFPEDFAFQLTRQEELAASMSHSVTSKAGHGGRRKLPWAFTEHGAIMLASVLNSPIAVEASVRVVRAFVYLREQLAASHVNRQEIAKRLTQLEGHVGEHDEALQLIFSTLRELIEPPVPEAETPKREIGFHIREEAPPYRVRTRVPHA